jgi:hypothetical protein
VSDQIDRFQDWLAEDDTPSSRRRFLIRVGKLGFSIFAALAGLSANTMRALATRQVFCCTLSFNTNCASASCSGCENCYSWSCCYYGSNPPRKYTCGECYSKSCSFYQWTGYCPQAAG